MIPYQKRVCGSQYRHGDSNPGHVPSRKLAIYKRDGSVRCEVLVDAEDYDRLREARWWLDHEGYVIRTFVRQGVKRKVRLHREVLELALADPRRVDHINGDRLDNRKANLRIATDAQNAQNQGSRGGSSQFRGVSWDRSKRRWYAQAQLNGRKVNLGRYRTEEEGAAAVAAWRAEHMPFSDEARVA